MTLVHTTYSTYEIDLENSRARRLEGQNEPTKNQGPDGTWRDFLGVYWLNDSLMFEWEWDGGVLRRTRTSDVVKVEGDLPLPQYGALA